MEIKNPVLNAIKDREFTDKVTKMLSTHGYAFIGVNEASDNPNEPTPAYVYTVGLHQRGFPDLFVSGNLPQETAMRLINHVIELWEIKGMKLGRINNFLLMADKRTKMGIGLKEVDLEDDASGAPSALKTHMPDLVKYFPDLEKRRVVQLLWPDVRGYLPINDGYTNDASEQQHLLNWK